MQDDYKKLNEYLNSFCLLYDYPLYMDYISEYLSLSVKARNMIFWGVKCGEIEDKVPDLSLSLSLDESIDLCEQFIETFLGCYYD